MPRRPETVSSEPMLDSDVESAEEAEVGSDSSSSASISDVFAAFMMETSNILTAVSQENSKVIQGMSKISENSQAIQKISKVSQETSALLAKLTSLAENSVTASANLSTEVAKLRQEIAHLRKPVTVTDDYELHALP